MGSLETVSSEEVPIAYPLELAKGFGAPCGAGTAPADLTVTGLAKALPYSWAEQESRIGFPPAIRVFRARGLPGRTKAFGLAAVRDLPSVALNTQRALCEPVTGPFHHQSSTLAKFPANSLLFVENSLLGIQKFPAPLRREFGCKPMDLLAEWRRKLANEPKIFKNSLQIPC